MFNLGFLASGLGSFSGSGMGDLGHLGLGELGYLAAMTAAERRTAAAEAKRKRLELAAAVAEARRTGGAKAAAAVRKSAAEVHRADVKHAAAAKKEQHVADAAARKKAAAAKKEERKLHKVGGKNVSLKAGEEKAAKNMESAVNGLKSAVAKCNALAKSAKMSRSKAARQAAMDCIKNTMATFSGGPVGMHGYTPPAQIMDARKHAAYYAMHPGGMRGLGLGVFDPITGQDDGMPDPNAVGYGPPTNVDYQTSGVPPMSGGTDPMQMMMMQQMMKPPDLPKQCQKNMNKPICQFYTLSQQSQQQMQFMMMIFMQLIQQLQSMLQDLSAQGPMAAGGAYPQVDPNTGMPYPAPTGAYPSFDTSGAGMMPPPGADGGMYSSPPMAMAPSGGAYSPGGVDQIPAGFDSGGDVPGAGGGDSFIPQDISISSGGYFTPPQAPQQTYAPGGDTYIQQEYNAPAEVIEMPQAPDAGNLPSALFSDEAIVDGQDTVPQFQQAQLQMPELVELAAGGAMPGPSQADIQNQYFETEQGGDGF